MTQPHGFSSTDLTQLAANSDTTAYNFSFVNGSDHNGTRDANETYIAPLRCISKNKKFLIAETTLVVFCFSIHVFLCTSLIIYRHKLRRKLINLYASNVVFANCIVSLLRLLDSMVEYFNHKDLEVVGSGLEWMEQKSLIYGWFMLRTLILTMFVVISGGIGLTVLAMHHDLFKLHRTVAGLHQHTIVAQETTPNKNNTSNSANLRFRFVRLVKDNPRTFAYVLIILSWVIPITLATIISYDGGCLNYCTCALHYIPSNKSIPVCPIEKGCNLFWPPVKNTILFTGIIVWFCFVVVLVVLLVRSFVNFWQIIKERRAAMSRYLRKEIEQHRQQAYIDLSAGVDASTNDSGAQDDTHGGGPFPPAVSTNIEPGIATISKYHVSCSLLLVSLKRNLFFIGIVAITYILGASIIVTLALVVSNTSDVAFIYENELKFIPLHAAPMLTEVTNSILLCVTLIGMRTAVKSLIRAIIHCSCFKMHCTNFH